MLIRIHLGDRGQQYRNRKWHGLGLSQMALKGIIFDLDGVLVDTVPAHFRAWQMMFAEYGYAFDQEQYRTLVDGRPRFEGARAVMTRHSDDEVGIAADRKNCYVMEMIERGEFSVFESALRFIHDCISHGLILAAASSSQNVRTVLRRAGMIDYFPIVIGGGDVKRGKPEPDIFLAAAEGMGLSPADCMVIEDSVVGVRAAQQGGFFCIGLAADRDDDLLKGADIVVTSLDLLTVEKLKGFLG